MINFLKLDYLIKLVILIRVRDSVRLTRPESGQLLLV